MIDPGLREWPGRDRAAGAPAPSVWPAAHGAGRAVGIALLVAALVVLAVALWRSQSASGLTLWLLWALVLAMVVLGAASLWLARSVGTMHYVLDDHQLSIRWLGRVHAVALAEIVEVEYDPHVPSPSSGWEPIWPGLVVWRRRRRDGLWHAWATLPPRMRVRIRTTSGGVEISPARPIRFLVDIDGRRARGGVAVPEPIPRRSQPEHRVEPAAPERPPAAPTPRPRPQPAPDEHVEQAVPDARGVARRGQLGMLGHAYHELFRGRILGDRVASNLLAVAVIIPLLMVAYLVSQIEGVPDPVALHWDALGEVDRVGPPSALWQLPILAIIVLVANTVLATVLAALDRFLTRLLLAATPIVQVIAAIALIRAVV